MVFDFKGIKIKEINNSKNYIFDMKVYYDAAADTFALKK